jgi:hypothetical protein
MFKTYLTLFFLALGIPLALIAALNFIVNPYGLYPTQIFPAISVNDLDTALRDLERPENEPQVVVLGSSRSRQLLARDLECNTGLPSANAAYQGATPQGYSALAAFLLKTKQPLPRMLIIGLDVEAFHNANLFGDKVSQVPRLQKYLSDFSRVQSIWLNATSLVSVGQLSDSLREVQYQYLTRPGIRLNPFTVAAASGKASNPTQDLPAEGLLRPDQEEINNYLARFNNYTALDEEQQGYFETLLSNAQRNHVRIKIFVTPMHPRLLEALNQQGYYPKRYKDVQAYIQQLRTRYPFEFYDFSRPDSFGGTDTDFVNLSHINADNGTRLIAALFEGDPLAKPCAPRLPLAP